ADVVNWLEVAASTYAQVMPGIADQPLLSPDYPATCLEMIAGLDYAIDLSVPALHGVPDAGARGPGRIRDLRYHGRPVTPDMQFALATNSHRIGIVQSRWGREPVMIGDQRRVSSREVLLQFLAREPQVSALPRLGWQFSAVPGASVIIDTAPAASCHLEDIRAFRPQSLGMTPEGFLRFRLHL
ncbi:MAG: bifunctional 2',3'-cyclic-nucleotide 2'-phosphodiesterase/3'-nucleotidase, partial [Paracoccaceae bacterium]